MMNIQKIQKGFTLIELMIVVAIIGILAAIAIPSYQDYTARAQVTEALTLGNGLKTPLAEWYSDQGSFPTALSNMGYNTVQGKYVDSAALTAGSPADTVWVDVTMKSSGINAGITSGVFRLEGTNGGTNWQCGSAASTPPTNPIADKYLPGACK